MKPHCLTLCALGPFAEEVQIDFDELVAEGLFLIHGSTGAGKTFLLDALCFALYGEVPGERGGHTLRSDHAPLDRRPWVELEFTSQGTRWRVRRSPSHDAAKVRGEGTTHRPATATLERFVGGAWETVAAKITEVTMEVTDLLGLTAQQFQQVLLLPQGGFQEVLRAKSDDRESLLRTLFDTTLFESASRWLDDQAKQRRIVVYEGERDLVTLRKQAAERWCSVAGEPKDDVHEHEAEVDVEVDAAGNEQDVGDAGPADQAALDTLVEQAAELLARADTGTREADADLSRLSAARDELKATADLWERQNALQRRRSELDGERSAIEQDKAALRRADAAEGLRELLDVEAGHRAALEAKTEAVAAHLAVVAGYRDGALGLPDELEFHGSTGSPDREALEAMRSTLISHRAVLERLAEEAEEAIRKREAATGQRKQQMDFRRAEATQDGEAAEAQGLIVQARQDLADSTAASQRMADLRTKAETTASRAAAADELMGLQLRVDHAERTMIDAKKSTLDRREQALELRQQHLDGIAGELAGTLASDKPCPVCGSREHPSPTERGGDAVSGVDVEAAEQIALEAERAERQARASHDVLANKAAELKGRAGAEAAADPAGAKALAGEAADELRAAAELAGRADELEAGVAELEAKIAKARSAAQQAAENAALAEQRADEVEQEALALQAGVTAEIDGGDPAAALKTVELLDAAAEQLAGAVGERATAQTAFDTTAETLARQIESSPFATTTECRSSLRSADERDGLRARIDEHEAAVIKVDHDLDAEELQEVPAERPDLAEPEALVDAAESIAKHAIEQRALAAQAHEDIAAWAQQHRSLDETLSDARHDATLWTSVSDRCNGRTTPKVSIQRWVLSAYLEEICLFANQRLDAMTGGRYQLKVHRDIERGGAKAGLGLRVRDAYTGQEREVSTLSGGETFQASLSLALGVADAVAAHSGGVGLEALFVDEGFGSLDPESLQLAMDELDRLREGGRTVGLISHVGALKERIRTGIEVTRTDHGSTVRVGALAPL